jgi:hypothetical protein
MGISLYRGELAVERESVPWLPLLFPLAEGSEMLTCVAGCGLGGFMSDMATVDDVEVPISRAGARFSGRYLSSRWIELTVLRLWSRGVRFCILPYGPTKLTSWTAGEGWKVKESSTAVPGVLDQW